MTAYRELLIGCGYRRIRLLDPHHYKSPTEGPQSEQRWHQVVSVDLNRNCKPDYVMDLEKGLETAQQPIGHDAELFKSIGDVYWQLKDSVFAEVHAYEVLEHLGHQGDATTFFGDFDELWRVLRPGGWLCATVPSRYSAWYWGDPGHRRALPPQCLQFLCRTNYAGLGRSQMSDYRPLFVGDWDVVHSFDNDETHSFILQAVKPARPDIP